MSLVQRLSSIPGLDCRWGIDLTAYSTFRLQSHGDLVKVSTLEALRELLPLLKERSRSWRVIGWGANQVLKQRESDLLIQLDLPFDLAFLNSVHEEYELPASLGLNHLTAHAVKFGLKGWEVLTGIPASLGGAVFMNAGTKFGEIKDLVKSVTLMNEEGKLRIHEIGSSSFSYRKNHFTVPGEIIVTATLKNLGLDASVPSKIQEYQNFRRTTQPLSSKNCGCVFKNASTHQQAGRLIDQTGLKGLQIGALRVSSKHANFMENQGGATSDEFWELHRLINQQMRLHWGVQFELEVKAL